MWVISRLASLDLSGLGLLFLDCLLNATTWEFMTRNGALICGYYGNYNLGDEAMLAGMLKLLQEQREDLTYTVLSDNLQDTQSRHSVKVLPRFPRSNVERIRRFIPDRYLNFLQHAYFILGGGDLLRDSSSYEVATVWLKLLRRAINLRRQTLVLGISVGEIWKPSTQALIPQTLNRVSLLTVRDEASKTKLETLGVQNPIHVMADLSLWALPEEPTPAIHTAGRPIQVGISVRSLHGRGGSIDEERYVAFQREMAAIADVLAEKYQAIVHFIPFQACKNRYRPTNDDYVSILELLRYSRCSEKFVVHRYIESLESLKQLIAGFSLMIGMRLHSLILAAGLGVPMIAAEYDSKVMGFMTEIGRVEHSLPLDRFERKRVLSIIEAILENPSCARKLTTVGVQRYRQRMTTVKPAIAQVLRAN